MLPTDIQPGTKMRRTRVEGEALKELELFTLRPADRIIIPLENFLPATV